MKLQGGLVLTVLVLAAVMPVEFLSAGGGVAGVTTPGSTVYPDNGLAIVGTAVGLLEERTACVVLDSAHGIGYFGASRLIVKMSLGSGGAPLVRLCHLRLGENVGRPQCAVIDEAGGYAWFGTENFVIKIRLTPGSDLPELVAILPMLPGETNLRHAVINTADGFACFFTEAGPARVIKIALGEGDAPPTRIGALTLNSGENNARAVAHIPGQNCALVGTDTAPARIVKVHLGDGAALPTRVGAATLSAGENYAVFAVAAPGSEYPLFVMETYPTAIIKVHAGGPGLPPVRASSLVLPPEQAYNLICGTYDWKSGQALMAVESSIPFGIIIKVAFGDGADPPALTVRSPSFTDSYDTYWHLAFSDPSTGYAYFTHQRDGGHATSILRKIDGGLGNAEPSEVGSASLADTETEAHISLFDPIARHVFGGSPNPQARFAKYDPGLAGQPPIRLCDVSVSSQIQTILQTAALDSAAGFAYFFNDDEIVKATLGAGNTPSAVLGAVATGISFPNGKSALIDSLNGRAFLAQGQYVKKFALGAGDTLPSLLNSTDFGPAYTFRAGGALDPSAGYAWLPASDKILKCSLGAGSNPVALVSTLDLADWFVMCGMADLEAGHGYYVVRKDELPVRLLKVDLGEGASAPMILGEMAFPPEAFFSTFLPAFGVFVVIDSEAGIGLVVDTGSRIKKFSLGAGNSPPTYVGSYYSTEYFPGDRDFNDISLDTATGHAFLIGDEFQFENNPEGAAHYSHLTKLAYTQMDALKATRFTMPVKGVVTSLHFYSHAAAGNVRLAVYSSASPRTLLWESPAVPNTVANGWLGVPVTSGSPPALTLPVGDYWLAWQVDTKRDVPSHTAGVQGDGLLIRREFGPAPAALDPLGPRMTAEKWSAYVAFDAPDNNAVFTSDTIPDTLAVGRGIYVGVSTRNTGNTQWTPANYRLAVLLDTCNLMSSAVPLDSIVNPNQVRQHVFFITAPPAPATCELQLQMEEFTPAPGLSAGGPGLFGSVFGTTIEIIEPPNRAVDWTVFE